MHKLLGIHSHHHHKSGRLIAVEHTSFGALFLVLLVFAPQLWSARGVLGTQTYSHDVAVTATVTGPAPTTSAQILSPQDEVVHKKLLVVSGSCGANLLVKVYSNSVFVGSTYCSSGGTFSLTISLFNGRNDLTALNFDNLDQPGPVGNMVIVNLTTLATANPKSPGNTKNYKANFYIVTDYSYRNIGLNQQSRWAIELKNGRAPFRLDAEWGDDNKNTVSLGNSRKTDVGHAFHQSGNYEIKFSATDAQQDQAYIQLGVTVNGPLPSGAGATTQKSYCGSSGATIFCGLGHQLLAIWVPLYWLMMAVIAVFWFNSYRKHKPQHNAPKPTHV